MKNEIQRLTNTFVTSILGVFNKSIKAVTLPRPRGLAALSPAERSVVALKAAQTRKRRAAANKAVATRKKNAKKAA
jgi:hypothetical protein